MASNAATFSINNTTGKGTPADVELLKSLKEKYKDRLELMVINTTIVSELIRHAVQPWRYVVFQLGRDVPYPKLEVKPSESVFEQIDMFLNKPKNYNPIKLYQEKEKEINAISVPEMMKNKSKKWILRVCSKDSCARSAYELYNLPLNVEVYKVDS